MLLALNIFLVFFAVLFSAAALLGKTWDSEKKRLTGVGYVAAFSLFLTLCFGIWKEIGTSRAAAFDAKKIASLKSELERSTNSQKALGDELTDIGGQIDGLSEKHRRQLEALKRTEAMSAETVKNIEKLGQMSSKIVNDNLQIHKDASTVKELAKILVKDLSEIGSEIDGLSEKQKQQLDSLSMTQAASTATVKNIQKLADLSDDLVNDNARLRKDADALKRLVAELPRTIRAIAGQQQNQTADFDDVLTKFQLGLNDFGKTKQADWTRISIVDQKSGNPLTLKSGETVHFRIKSANKTGEFDKFVDTAYEVARKYDRKLPLAFLVVGAKRYPLYRLQGTIEFVDSLATSKGVSVEIVGRADEWDILVLATTAP